MRQDAIPINFVQGLDLKTDPLQIAAGRFEQLSNSVFDKTGRMTKRNGFAQITALPDATSTYVTTFNGNLTAIGTDLKALAQGPQAWVKVSQFTPLQVSTQPLVRNNNNQTQCDVAISDNDLACVVYTDLVSSGTSTTNIYRYAVYARSTGQALIPPTQVQTTFGTNLFAPRVFNLSPYFVLLFDGTTGSTSHLQYQAISQTTVGIVGSATDVTTSYAPQSGGTFDGVVANNTLYMSWNGASNSGIKSAYLNSFLTLSGNVTIASATQVQAISVTADNSQTTPVIWTTFGIGSSGGALIGNTVATNGLTTLFSARTITTGNAIKNFSTFATGNRLSVFYEVTNAYTYNGNIPTNFINYKTVNSVGSASAEELFKRSVGLASKSFLVGSVGYVMGAYQSSYQPTYFLMNSSASILARIAYGNGGGYVTTGLPQVTLSSQTAYVGYLFKDLVQAVNKNTGVGSTTQTAGIYAQTGVNLAGFTFSSSELTTTETAGCLLLSGGMLNQYDGTQLVENNFNVWPDDIKVVATSSANYGGLVAPGTYFLQATYEWQDSAGNLQKSSPSIPVSVVISSGTSAIQINVPTLRLTAKTLNPVKIVIYRWSTLQQSYYQTTSITQPILNTTLSDFITYTDSKSDAQVLGNNLLYTTGGVVENTGANPSHAVSQFDSRLWSIDAEDPNLLRFSKQVLETTPVEMSESLTYYVQPNAGAQGSTGPMKCIAPMDDKLIEFKKNAIYYTAGTGPDNTGANNQYTQPIFVTATVGTENQASIVLIPQGLMFQSDKGIWLLGRDLSTQYIGKDVETFNGQKVTSAVVVPGTNQVRFSLETGVTLVYDYFQNAWDTFKGINPIASCLYQNKHTFIDRYGRVFQETPGTYLDGSSPTLLSFKTGWLALAGLQGYQRAYSLLLLGEYFTPHRLTIGIAYDYDPSLVQLATLIPSNYSAPWGDDVTWGTISTWGGSSRNEQWQVNLRYQQCQSIQITFNEYYDPSIGAPAGAGLTLSGMKLLCGMASNTPRNLGFRQRQE